MKTFLSFVSAMALAVTAFGEGSETLKLGTQTHNVQSPLTINWTGTTQDFTGATVSGLPTGSGTVTSVDLTAPAAGITVSGGPITTSGSITLALANDLAALEALSGTNTIYYRSGTSAWSAVTIGSNLTFSAGTLSASGGGTPGGSDTQVQYNNAGAFGGITNATTDGSTLTLTSPAITTPTGLVKGDVGLGSVTNDAQTKAAIVPNTAPSAGQILVGNGGGTAYAPQTLTGSGATATISSAGVLTLSAIPNATLSNSAITIAGTSTSLGGTISLDTISGVSSNGFLKRTGANAWTNDSSTYLTGNQTITLTGNVTGSGATSIATTLAAGNAGNLDSGTLLAARMPAFTGDVTTSAGAVATTLGNIPDATTAAGSILFTDIAAPSSPAASHLKIFGDSTDLRFHDKNAAGTIGTTVVSDTGSSNNFLTAVSAAGVISKAQPAIANVSDATTVGQNIVKLTNPGAITFLRINADNTVTARSAANFKTDLSLTIGTDVEAWDTQLDSLGGLTYSANALKVIRVNAGETGFELAAAGSGTVTATGGSLTSNAVVLGAGTTDTKVSTGIITDGTAKLTLGVNTTTLGQLKLFGSTSGDATIQPPVVAGSATVVTLPNASSTLPIYPQQITYTGPTAARSVTYPDASFTVARTDAANTFTGHQTIEGVATAGATGTGNLVFATSPTLTTAVLGSSTATTQAANDNSTKVSTTAYVDGNTTNHGGWASKFVSGSDFTTTNLTATTITGLTSDTLSNSTRYEIDLDLYVSTSSAAGLKFAVTAGGGGTAATIAISGNQATGGASFVGMGLITIDSLGATGFGSTGDGVANMRGFLTTRSTGTANISIQIAKVTSGTATVYQGSVFRYRQAGQ